MRSIVILCLITAAAGAACTPEPSMPTLAAFPTEPPSEVALSTTVTAEPPTAAPPASLTPTRALPRATPTDPRLSLRPTEPPFDPNRVTPDGAITFDDIPARYDDARRIAFIARITPHKLKLRKATLIYTYPVTNETQEQEVPLTPQTLGQQMNPLQWSMSVDNMPMAEDTLLYRWRLLDEQGGTLFSEERKFKLTEAITAERRDDLPIIEAETSYKSEFPKRSIFTVTLTPEVPITNARFMFTQNNGILLRDYNVRVPTRKKGETLTLTFSWDDQIAEQIPWQQFESWWVLRDQNNKVWRTKPMFNDYADNRFHKWTRTETKYAVLYTYDQRAANINALAQATDESYERLRGMYGYDLRYRPHVVVYNTQAHFAEWAPPQYVESFIGMASGEWGGCVVTFYDSIRYTGYNIIQHEFVHLFQYQSIRDRSYQQVPKWWYEGSARYFETANDLDRMEKIVRQYAQAYGPSNLEATVETLIPPDGSDLPWPYFMGMTVVKFLRESYGDDVFRLIHLYLARKIRFKEAVRLAVGKPYSQVNVEYQQWITKDN